MAGYGRDRPVRADVEPGVNDFDTAVLTGPFQQTAPYELDDLEEAALRRARKAGTAAAGWVHALADRQTDASHAGALRRAAEAIEEASSTAIVPGGDGDAQGQVRYRLAPSALVSPHPHETRDEETLPDLTAAERLALIAVCALSADMPTTVIGYFPSELTALTVALEAAVAATTEGGTGRHR
ncbi:hypothetical protein AB0K51_31480 [Kitasatospora sp. NPDC049285]|uniref:hypothetical protein n=1 Tax=Kitasatospora sp. NPDC049285 TaxID=3157096 RepID=UPI0034241B76